MSYILEPMPACSSALFGLGRYWGVLIVTAAVAFLPPMAHAQPAQDPLKTDLLAVFAHPDDETGVAATLARYALGHSKVVATAYVTRGEGGGNMVGTQSGPALGMLREAELRQCLTKLGVRHVAFLDQEDFFYTESLAATFRKWDRAECLARLVRIIRVLRPEIIVTMNPTPAPGQHGHHQGAAILATEAFHAAADPAFEPSQVEQEGIQPWTTRKLFYSGALGPWTTTLATTESLPGGASPAEIAADALSHHVSQAFGNIARSPWLRRPQVFSLIRSVVPPTSGGSDLFEELPAEAPFVHQRLVESPQTEPLRFRPRPAIARFRTWAAENQLAWMAAEFRADLPVVAGEANDVVVEVDHSLESEWRSAISWELPSGWTFVRRPTWHRPLQAGDPAEIRLSVGVPTSAASITEIAALLKSPSSTSRASAKLHPVPRSRVPRVRSLQLTRDWESLMSSAPRLAITPDQSWQGTVTQASDCSAEFRLLHDGHHLAVDVLVQDDRVVSNIAPDDIKGHWRSDSIEICLDPHAGAEDTTDSLKIGIFPFDTLGQVRAARDADARQGPIERTAPGLKLASEKTPNGYRIRALIPLELLGPGGTAPRRAPRRLGFNVLIYDGDKADAERGENINKSRLAWSPRSGVQGRPEDWGRIDLE